MNKSLLEKEDLQMKKKRMLVMMSTLGVTTLRALMLYLHSLPICAKKRSSNV